MPLFVVPTPIGNLADITLRALDVLRDAELILCEDTRVSRVLLAAYDIRRPTMSYHKFNERSRSNGLIERLRENEQIALISSAGTPGISDPGQRLIATCYNESIEVTVLPGACSAITALVASAQSDSPFQVIGFLEQNGRKQLQRILSYCGTSICFVSPHRVVQTLKSAREVAEQMGDPLRTFVLLKELTKRFEKRFEGSASQLLEDFVVGGQSTKGEWILVVSPPATPSKCDKSLPSDVDVGSAWESGLAQGLSTKQIVDDLARRFDVKRQKLYQLLNAKERKG